MPFSRLFAGPLTVGTTVAGLAAGSVLAVVAYRDLAATPPPAPLPLTVAEARGPHPAAVPAPRIVHRPAPCRGSARVVGRACVTTVERTVVVTDPAPAAPAAAPPPAAAPAVSPRPVARPRRPARTVSASAAAPTGRAKPPAEREHEPREHESHDD